MAVSDVARAAGAAPTTLDVESVRADFPMMSREVDGARIAYLDSAASSQKPRAVLEAMDRIYRHSYANVHRGVYKVAEEATAAYEGARARIGRFVGAPDPRHEIVFTKNVTEAINLVAHSWGGANLGPGDAVLLTQLEHHANIVPWHQLRDRLGFELRWLPVDAGHRLDLSELDRLLDGVRLVGLSAMSNVLGTLPPVRRIADAAHEKGALVLVDGAQYTPHLPTDVTELGADFYAFTGHKMCGPTGIGVLWAPADLLDSMPPFLGGGEMILDVRTDGFTPNELPWKFEAGTPPFVEAVGLAAACDYLDGLGMECVRRHEVELVGYALRSLAERFGDDLVIHGPDEPGDRGGALSFAYKDVHPHDLSQVLDQHNVCVRAGHHCAKPLLREVLGVGATARASLYVYNDTDDIDALGDAIAECDELFGF